MRFGAALATRRTFASTFGWPRARPPRSGDVHTGYVMMRTRLCLWIPLRQPPATARRSQLDRPLMQPGFSCRHRDSRAIESDLHNPECSCASHCSVSIRDVQPVVGIVDVPLSVRNRVHLSPSPAIRKSFPYLILRSQHLTNARRTPSIARNRLVTRCFSRRCCFCALASATASRVTSMKMSKIEMLTPENSAIALIDYQPAMFQGVQSHDRLVPFNNVQAPP